MWAYLQLFRFLTWSNYWCFFHCCRRCPAGISAMALWGRHFAFHVTTSEDSELRRTLQEIPCCFKSKYFLLYLQFTAWSLHWFKSCQTVPTVVGGGTLTNPVFTLNSFSKPPESRFETVIKNSWIKLHVFMFLFQSQSQLCSKLTSGWISPLTSRNSLHLQS